ncbi:MAG TPA: nuclear transport factor 2 family protein [Luteibaculaceae bacterium]|nr:nuclear transport factor 2 family protein [Luteibaculaceae bacterium]
MKYTSWVAAVLTSFCLVACAPSKDKSEEEILKAMKKQALAWNAGDIAGFMSAYQQSDSLIFVGNKGVTYGWLATLNNYRKNYSSREKMGQLTFETIKMDHLAPDAVFHLGTWQLKRTQDTIGGYFTLIWKQVDGKWVITSDHTS